MSEGGSPGADATSLRDVRVLVTRPPGREGDWIDALGRAGAIAEHVPVFSLAGVSGGRIQEVRKRLLDGASRVSWLVFTSVLGAQQAGRLFEAREVVGRFRIASVGGATTRTLEEAGFRVDCQPEEATARALGNALCRMEAAPVVHHLTAEGGMQHLRDAIVGAAGTYVAHWVYERVFIEELRDTDLGRIDGCDVLTFASPSAASTLCRLWDASALDLGGALRSKPSVAIGPTTEVALKDLGFSSVVVAANPSVEALVKAVGVAVAH